MNKWRNQILAIGLTTVMILTTAVPAFAECGAEGPEAERAVAVEAAAGPAADVIAADPAASNALAAATAAPNAPAADTAAPEASAADPAASDAPAAGAAETKATASDITGTDVTAAGTEATESEPDAAAGTEATESEPDAAAGTEATESEPDTAAVGPETAEAAGPEEAAAVTEAAAVRAETAVSAPNEEKREDAAAVLNTKSSFDNSTDLKDGTYTPSDYTFTGGTGKARYDCETVTVKNGKATAILKASSANMTHIYLGTAGQTTGDDLSLFDPYTGAIGEDVYAVTDKQVEVPVKLNADMAVAGRTTAMSVPHWINYTIHITVTADEEEDGDTFDNSTALPDGTYTPSDCTFTGGTGKARYDCDKVIVKNGKATALLVSSSANMTHLYLGEAESSEGEIAALYDPETGKTGSLVYPVENKRVEVPVRLNVDMPVASRTTAMSSPHWINYTMHITVTEDDREESEETCVLTVKVADDATGDEIADAQVTVTDASGKEKTAADGRYILTSGESYTVKASADGYEEASQTYTASGDEILTIALTKEEGPAPVEGELTILESPKMFPVAAASLEGTGADKKLVIFMGGTGAYSRLFKGSKEDAAVSNESRRIKAEAVTVKGQKRWKFIIPVTTEGAFAVAALSKSNNSWYDRTFTLDQKAMTLSVVAADPYKSVPVPDGKDSSGQKEEPKTDDKSSQGSGSGSGSNDASNVTPAAVNSSTTLADGTYGPGEYTFSFSGGTGKVVIVCQKVVVRGGQAYVTIAFQKPDGRASSVDSVRASGMTYGGNNVFEIPVRLNTNNTIVARTTAMSQPHWVEYRIFIGISEPGKAPLSLSTKAMDDKAPEITGLVVKNETEVVYSDRIRIFNYENDIYLIEVDMVTDTARENAAEKESDPVDKETAAGGDGTGAAADENDSASDSAAGDGIDTAEEESVAAESEAAVTAKLYLQDVVKYLVIPADADIPAGLGKEVVVIQQPADKTYVSSAGALKLLADLGVLDQINTIGIEKEAVTVDEVLKALGDKDVRDKAIISFAGPYDNWDLRQMILKKTNFAVQSSEFLPKDEETYEDDWKNFKRLTSRSAQMGFACFVDRSEDEENDLAAAEWYRVYGIIFGELDKAEAAYNKVVKAASEADKKAALKQLEERAEKAAKRAEKQD